MTITTPKKWTHLADQSSALRTLIHTVPLEDTREHSLSVGCACRPRVNDYPNAGRHVIHNSFDGREFVEFALRCAWSARN